MRFILEENGLDCYGGAFIFVVENYALCHCESRINLLAHEQRHSNSIVAIC
jgi:hypothetical protein